MGERVLGLPGADATQGVDLVAAMQGRIAMWHALGDAVSPLNVTGVAANIFTEPEIASSGLTVEEAEAKGLKTNIGKFPFAASGRAMAMRF